MNYLSNASSYWFIFKQLCREELADFYNYLKDRTLNQGIWLAVTTISAVYLMGTQFHITSDFGIFMLTGCIGTIGLFEAFPNVWYLVGDFEGDRRISYYMILPTPAWLIFLKHIVCMTVWGVSIGFLLIPLGKLVLWNQFSLTQVAWFKFGLLFIVGNIAIAAFTLWLSTIISSLSKLRNLWCRFIFPIWFLSGFQFSWTTMYGIYKPCAYLMLANPMTYVMEGTRATMIGQEGYLNIWVCIGMLIVFTVLFTTYAMMRLKKRLDFV